MMTIFKVENAAESATSVVSGMRCPACGHIVGFEPVGVNDIFLPRSAVKLGQRRCGNTQCLAHLFLAIDREGNVICSYPAERLDFDSTNLPPKVRDTLEESITCHANMCYTAAAMLVRKTLEAMCEHREATGNTLKQRIESLKDKIVLPSALFKGMDKLRILGNDATHVEAKIYEEIGKEHVETAIEFAKEILKAAYQYGTLLKRLDDLPLASDAESQTPGK